MQNTMDSWHAGHYRYTTPEDNSKAWKRFISLDKFASPPNKLAGYIQVTGGDEYGALWITEVNDRPAPQYIRCTPKASYPFNKHGHWMMSGEESIEAYEKLDGTNIFQYVYLDADGNSFTTFKTRTLATLSVRFQMLVEEALQAIPVVRDVELPTGIGFGYELTGYKNPHLIRYDYPIAMHVLYARNCGELIGIHDDPALFKALDCPMPEVHTWTADEVEVEYRRRQQAFAAATTEIETDVFDGTEGDMLYVKFPDGARPGLGSFTRLLKCKSPLVEIIHWRSDKVHGEEIRATARNMWEVADEPTVNDLKMLLAEEWTDLQIDKSADVIRNIYEEVMANRRWQDSVLDVFNEVSSVEQWVNAPGDTMRAIAKTGRFDNKRDMNKVFSALRERV